MVGRMKVSKPAVRQGSWDELQLLEVSRHTQQILDELRADARLHSTRAMAMAKSTLGG
jgi:hypothetical protein